MNGILLNIDYDLQIKPKLDESGLIVSGLSIGDITDQAAALVLQMSPGELKEDPVLGCGLTKFIRGKYSASQIEQRIKTHFSRVGLNFDEYKERLSINIKTAE